MNCPEDIKKAVKDKFRRLGINKKREIIRLIYEISKRESTDFVGIISEISQKKKFADIKAALIRRRFPEASRAGEKINPYLPDIDILKDNRMYPGDGTLQPENIYYDEISSNSAVLKKIKQTIPDGNYTQIGSLKEYSMNRAFSLKTYNFRRKNLFIVSEDYDFFRRCPCTKKCVCCDYHIFNLSFGCPYECTYCYLQEYTNTHGIIIHSNINDFFDSFHKRKISSKRIGTGEFTDSLVLDGITGYSAMIIELFRKYPDMLFEFKTKSTNIGNILKTKPARNVIISWSLNPQSFIDENEFFSASLRERIEAAKTCVDAGYDVSFHFDPIVYSRRWESEYEELVDLLFGSIKGEHIRWISLGTFRFSRQLKKVIENRFPENNILDGELILGFDGKLRYTDTVRTKIYTKMSGWIKKHSRKPFVYLCMENRSIWSQCGIDTEWRWS